MASVLLKIHESYRIVVAVCDADVFGRKLTDAGASEESGIRNQESGRRVLDVSGGFFDGETLNLADAREELVRLAGEDATFNFVGKESVELAKEIGLVLEEGVMEIEGIPFALVLL